MHDDDIPVDDSAVVVACCAVGGCCAVVGSSRSKEMAEKVRKASKQILIGLGGKRVKLTRFMCKVLL